MTREELVKAIEGLIGMPLTPGRDARTLNVLAPNGTLLFSISLFVNESGWHFGGCGSPLAEHWRPLCDLSRWEP